MVEDVIVEPEPFTVVEHEPFNENMGPVDAVVRFVLAASVLVAAIWLLPRVDPAWILPVIIGALPVVAYLLLTAIVRTDIAYHFVGRAPYRVRARERRLRRGRSARPLR